MILLKPQVTVENFDGKKILRNIERACRTCYRSEDKISQDSYKSLLKNAIARGHESILEHEKITVRLLCDIGVYKDLTRHRHASFSIESTRYCNYSKDKFGNNLKMIIPLFSDDSEKFNIWSDAILALEESYMEMAKLSNIKADELRMLLPHSTAAEVTMTANIREWRHILNLRTKKMTHPAVRQVLIPLLLCFKETMPELFEDIEYDTDFPIEKYAQLSIEQ